MMVMFEHSFTFHLHSYENARFKVDAIFGQRFIPGFPQTLVPCGQAIGCGSYPSTSGGLYRAGIDLSVPAGTKVTLNIIAAGGVEERGRMEGVERGGGREMVESVGEGWREGEDGECGEGWRGAR